MPIAPVPARLVTFLMVAAHLLLSFSAYGHPGGNHICPKTALLPYRDKCDGPCTVIPLARPPTKDTVATQRRLSAKLNSQSGSAHHWPKDWPCGRPVLTTAVLPSRSWVLGLGGRGVPRRVHGRAGR